ELIEQLRGKRDGTATNKRAAAGELRPDVVRMKNGRAEIKDPITTVTVVAGGLGGVVEADGDATAQVASLGVLTRWGPYAKLGPLIVQTRVDDLLGAAVLEVGGGEVVLWT